jgi:hypothetical protein
MPRPLSARISLLILISLLAAIDLHAQSREKVLNIDTGRVVLHYFTSGEVSTKEWVDKDERWGRSWAFAKDGRVLIDQQTRRVGGHASVHFSYHPNGAVSKAEFSDAPDGGIQWYQSTTTFDENGNKTGFTEQGHDDDGLILRPDTRVIEKPQVVEPPKPTIAECQKLYVNEVVVMNSTKWACVVKVQPKSASPALPGGTFTLQPGDTLRAGTYTMGEVFDDPANHVTMTAQRVNGKRKSTAMEIPMLQQRQVSKEHRRYVYHVLPEGTRLKLLQ